MLSPSITIYVRHSAGCKYAPDEFARRCDCRKHLRWSVSGKQFRRMAGTRSWAEAERVKHNLEDNLAGRIAEHATTADLRASIKVFIEDKRVQGVSAGVIDKYERELSRFREHCERLGVYTVQGVTRELLTGYCATWEKLYPSTLTQSSVRTRTRGFLRYAYEAKWLDRVPALPKIKVDEPPTLPLTDSEYARLLKAVSVFGDPIRSARVRALFQLMRWSGLAIRDALTLPKAALTNNRGLYRVTTHRQKPGRMYRCRSRPKSPKRSSQLPTMGHTSSGIGHRQSLDKILHRTGFQRREDHF